MDFSGNGMIKLDIQDISIYFDDLHVLDLVVE